MSRTEPELVTLRELADELAGEPSTARTWAKVVRGQTVDTPAPRPARRRERFAIGPRRRPSSRWPSPSP